VALWKASFIFFSLCQSLVFTSFDHIFITIFMALLG